MEPQGNPIDWEQSLALSNHSSELAEELLMMLKNELPEFNQNIQQTLNEKNYEGLYNLLHKLHGSCCYCGVPRLKEKVMAAENDLKNKDYSELTHKISSVKKEVSTILNALEDDDYR